MNRYTKLLGLGLRKLKPSSEPTHNICYKTTVVFDRIIKAKGSDIAMVSSVNEQATGLVMADSVAMAVKKARIRMEADNSETMTTTVKSVTAVPADETTHGFFISFFVR